MKRKIINLLKKVYAKLLKLDFVYKRRNKIKRKIKKYRRKKLEKFKAGVFAKYDNVTLEDTRFEKVTLERDENRNTLFGFDVLGQLKDLKDCDYIDYATNLGSILSNPDIDIKIAYADEDEVGAETLAYFRKSMNMLAVSDKKSYFIESGDYKVAVIGTSIEREGQVDDAPIDETLLKDIVYAKNNGVNYTVIYVKREAHKSINFTPYERAQIRFMANMGVSAIFASNEEGIHVGGNIMRMDRNFTNAVCSIGALGKSGEESKGAAINIRFKIIPGASESQVIVNKGYIPLYTDFETDEYKNVVRIDYHNGEHRRNQNMMDALKYIENETSKLRDIRNILTIKDICDILNVELPQQWAYLADASVGKVCARSFEVNSGDVFFFREPFTDPNDKEPAPLEIRKKVVDVAMNRGCRFVFSYADLDETIPHVKLDSAREGHIAVCARIRQFYEVKTIGITGSVGKTSTKDMLYNVLNEKYATYRNLRNSNTQVNIGLHIQDFRGDYEFFIQEIGGGRPGGASRHSRMILPSATVVTNIGHAHIGNYGTQEAIMESKLGIVEGMDKKGTLFLNGDDPLLITAKVPVETVFYAVNNHDADYYADDISESNGQTFFTIVHGEERIPAMLNVLGEYNILNAVGCFAIGRKFGISDEDIVRGISKFETSGVRQNLISVAGRNLFVDCFNASPASVNSSLSVLDKIEIEEGNKKIAVLGDITGAGEELSKDIHEEVGNIVKTHQMDILICYGEESKLVYEMSKADGYNAVHITEPYELEKFIKANAKAGDVVLFKGSSKMLLAERIDSMYGTMLADQRYIDGVKFKTAVTGKIKYNLYPEYATAVDAADVEGKLTIARTVKGRPVYNLGDGAFSDKENITGVNIHNSIRHIGDGCFNACGNIKRIDLPASIKYIGERAFAACGSLSKLTMQEGILHIASEAFAECSELTELYLPDSIQEMGENVFANCDNLTVYCGKGTYAADYCETNGVQYKLK